MSDIGRIEFGPAATDEALRLRAEITRLRAENARLREALREAVIVGPQGKPGTRWTITCWQCNHAWAEGDPEHHAPDCLAAPKEGER